MSRKPPSNGAESPDGHVADSLRQGLYGTNPARTESPGSEDPFGTSAARVDVATDEGGTCGDGGAQSRSRNSCRRTPAGRGRPAGDDEAGSLNPVAVAS